MGGAQLSIDEAPTTPTTSDSTPSAIEYRVQRGERLLTIANRYNVSLDDLIGWNGLDVKKPVIREGQILRILVPADTKQRRRRQYVVRPGDSWAKIARRFGVAEEKLRRHWNPGQDELRAGDRLNLWVIGARPSRGTSRGAGLSSSATDANVSAEAERPLLVSTVSRSFPTPTLAPGPVPEPLPDPERPRHKFAIISVPPTAVSVGSPGRGKLKNGIQLPVNDALYTIRNPNHSWCSSHLIEYLQRAIANFRETTGYERQILIQDTSRRGGGHFRPHVSHRQGRDVDIQLPMRAGVPPRAIPTKMGMVDWDATWQLVKAFIATGSVKYIFLSRSRQLELYRAAKRSGASEAEIRQYLQYPRGVSTAVVRHSKGHEKHFHVRFTCAPYEADCHD